MASGDRGEVPHATHAAHATHRDPSMSHIDHKATSPASVRCYVLTISDTRKPGTDTSGIGDRGAARGERP